MGHKQSTPGQHEQERAPSSGMAPGRNIVSDRTKVIQPLERSVVQRILVKDGDHVEAGQTLVTLDPTAAQADKASLSETTRAAESEGLRSRILLQALSKKELPALV